MAHEVISIFKPAGFTPTQLISIFKERFPQYAQEKISPAGRLDPMAEGVIILLIGNANKERNKFLELDKMYEFTILFGMSSDTYDLLGKITEIKSDYKTTLIKKNLSKILPSYIGTIRQEYPPYSSKPVKGIPLFSWARQEKLAEIEIPSKTIEIKNILIHGWEDIEKETLKEEAVRRIINVRGDFRQQEIINQWRTLTDIRESILLAHCTASVTSGTYIRSLCHSLGQELGIGALAYSINRISIGDYHVEDALRLTA